MVNICAIKGCKNQSGNKLGITLHRFPINNEECQTWKVVCGVKITNSSQHLRACSAHFIINDFDASCKRPHLKEGAIPSRNLPSTNNISTSSDTTTTSSHSKEEWDLVRNLKKINNKLRERIRTLEISKRKAVRSKLSWKSGYNLQVKQKRTSSRSKDSEIKLLKDMKPGILYPVINLLKQEFASAEDFRRECVLSFDEVSIDSGVEYDPNEDKIYGPKTNMNVTFVRGLFDGYKQPISYNFDEQFTVQKFLEIIEVLHHAGLRVRANVNDLGGENRGLWNKLGVNVRKANSNDVDNYGVTSCIKHPVSGENIYFFADAPHLIKLLRNNLFNHGLTLKGGYKLLKSDFERLLKIDCGELKANFKLTENHLNLKGRQKQRVLPAVQVFSKTTAEVYKLAFPNKSAQSEFIELVNDYFDVMNSRTPNQSILKKQPFGMNLKDQMIILDRMEDAILNLVVGESKHLYPFQRGYMISIHSMKGIFYDLSSGSLRANYILTHRLNTDIAENAFSVIRNIGGVSDNPTPVDAKRRLKLLMLSWGSQVSRSAPVEQLESQEPYLSGKMIQALMKPIEQNTEENPPDRCTSNDINLCESIPEVDMLSEESLEEIILAMGISQRCAESGSEYLAGYVASKFKKEYPELVASPEQLEGLNGLSWVLALTQGGLTVPSLEWRNTCAILNKEFDMFHSAEGSLGLSKKEGVFIGFCKALSKKYPDIPYKLLQKFIKCRLFIRIKAVNRKLTKERIERRNRRMHKEVHTVVREEESDNGLSDDEDYEEADFSPEERNEEYLYTPGPAAARFQDFLNGEFI